MKNRIVLYIAVFLFFFLTASGNIDSIDAITHGYLAKQIVTQGKINFGKELILPELVTRANDKTGNYYPIYNFGYAILLIPGVLFSLFVHSLLHVRNASFPAAPDWILTWYMNMFNTVILILIAVTIRKLITLFSHKIRMPNYIDLFILIGIFTSNLVIQTHEHFVHLLFTLFACLAFEQLLYYFQKNRFKYLCLFSLYITMGAASYNTSFLFLIPPFVALFIYHERGKPNFMSRFEIFCMTFVPAMAMQAIWDILRFGNPLLTGYHGRSEGIYVFHFVEMVKHIYGMTLGPNKGLLLYSPFLLFSYWYVAKTFRQQSKPFRSFAVFWIVLTITYVLSYSPVIFWHGDSAYGPRYLTPIVVFGLVPFVCFLNTLGNKPALLVTMSVLIFGILVQIPGMLIPNFTYRFITKQSCVQSERWYYDPRCTPFLIGWAQLIKRETKETPLIFQNGPLITEKYPNPLAPFKTIYPDPLFDAFSPYKTANYKVSNDLLNNIYAFSLDLWWVKIRYYKNILP